MGVLRDRSTLSLLSAVLMLTSAVPALAQFQSRPYDAEAVSRAALEIREVIAHPRGIEEELGRPLQFVVESLQNVSDLSVVSDEVLNSVVACAGTGGMAKSAIVRFGDRAVMSLVSTAHIAPADHDEARRFGAIEILSEMLERDDITHNLAPGSRAEAKQLAEILLADKTLMVITLGGASRLALATHDPVLRAEVVRLADPSELKARGIRAQLQPGVVSRIKRDLEKSQRR